MSTPVRKHDDDDRRQLLRWALRYVESWNAVLTDSHTNHATGKITPAKIREEVRDAKRWIRQTTLALKR